MTVEQGDELIEDVFFVRDVGFFNASHAIGSALSVDEGLQ